MKNRLADPSEIYALDFKHEFRRSAIGSVSATIGVDRSIFDIRRRPAVILCSTKNTVTEWRHLLSSGASQAAVFGPSLAVATSAEDCGRRADARL
jgi:hypothetical protein